MDIRPRAYERTLAVIAAAAESERLRRGLSIAALARLIGWNSRQREADLSRFLKGDLRALGMEAAHRVVDRLDLVVETQVFVRAVRPRSPSLIPTMRAA